MSKLKALFVFLSVLNANILTTSALLQPPKTRQANDRLITPGTEEYINTVLKKWNSSGLSVAVVCKDPSDPTGWNQEFGSYGVAYPDGRSATPDSVYSIGSNSKLFLAISVGLLIKNETLAAETGRRLSYNTKIRDLIPEWGVMDEAIQDGATIQDLLSHRTGLPRHDFTIGRRSGGLKDMISTLRFLRPSAEFRDTFQYNNMMYEVLAYLPQVLLNQSYESYVTQHIFKPLDMNSTTFSLDEVEGTGRLVAGYQRDLADVYLGKNGTLKPTVPFFLRPKDIGIWSGSGGILSSSRDMATWVATLLNNGRHPSKNETVIPSDIIQRCATGRSVASGSPPFPELSSQVYGAGQFRYSYRGNDLIEHGGSSLGFMTQVARLPNNNLGIIALSNDGQGNFIYDAAKFRIIDDVLGLPPIDWSSRFEQVVLAQQGNLKNSATPKPANATSPEASFEDLAEGTFEHPTYGRFQPCLVPSSVPSGGREFNAHLHCDSLLASYPIKRLMEHAAVSNSSRSVPAPTYIIPVKKSLVTYFRLEHFDNNIFNVTAVWTNADERIAEGLVQGNSTEVVDEGLMMTLRDERYEMEWVHGDEPGLAFRKFIWGGGSASTPGGSGKDSAEAWFGKV